MWHIKGTNSPRADLSILSNAQWEDLSILSDALQFNNAGLQNCTCTGKKFCLKQRVCSAPKNFVGESLGQTEVTVYYSLPENKYVNQPGFQLNLTFSGDKLDLKVFREANGIFSFPPAFSSQECNDLHLGKLGSTVRNDLL